MFYDALTLRAYGFELEQRFPLPWFVQKISQIDTYDFLLAFRLGPGKNLRLLVSLQPGKAGLYWWRAPKPQARIPSSFAMLCRKHLQGRSVERLEVLYPERIVRLAGREYSLVLELLDRQPNILLLNHAEMISGALRFGKSVRPNRPYQLPVRPDVPEAQQLSNYQLEEIYLADPPGFPETLLKHCFGLSKAACSKLAQLMRPELPLEERLSWAWCELWKYAGSAYLVDRLVDGRRTIWGSQASQLLDLEPEQDVLPALEATRKRILQGLKRGIKKLQQRVLKLNDDQSKLQQADVLQRKGELLLCNQQFVQPGTTEVDLLDWDGETVYHLDLEPGIPVRVLAQKWLKQAAKYRRSSTIVATRMQETQQEIRQLEETIYAVEQADQLEDLEQFTLSKRLKPVRVKTSGPRRYNFQEFHLLVGRSPAQNDQLIRKYSTRDDLWFHVKDAPGAHVLLKTAGQSPDEQVVEAAAQLAAHYSSRAKDSRVLVAFTSAQRVKKTAGLAAGVVLYKDELTLWVQPSPLDERLLRCE